MPVAPDGRGEAVAATDTPADMPVGVCATAAGIVAVEKGVGKKAVREGAQLLSGLGNFWGSRCLLTA